MTKTTDEQNMAVATSEVYSRAVGSLSEDTMDDLVEEIERGVGRFPHRGQEVEPTSYRENAVRLAVTAMKLAVVCAVEADEPDTFYAHEDHEGTLTERNLHDAIDMYVDGLAGEHGPDWKSHLHGMKVPFVRFSPKRVDRDYVRYVRPLEIELETLDERYACNDDAIATEPNETMRQAERQFVDTLLAEYEVQDYEGEPSSRVEVDLEDWVKRNPPESYEEWQPTGGPPASVDTVGGDS